MEKLLTPKQQEREAMYESIVERYKELREQYPDAKEYRIFATIAGEGLGIQTPIGVRQIIKKRIAV